MAVIRRGFVDRFGSPVAGKRLRKSDGNAIGRRALFRVRKSIFEYLYKYYISKTQICDLYLNFSLDYCYDLPMACEARGIRGLKPHEVRNRWFYNNENSRCQVFTWTCGNHYNRFETFEKCEAHCVTGEKNEMYNESRNVTEVAGEPEIAPKGRWWNG